MIRYNRHRNKIYFDHSELLSDPGIHAILGRPKPRAPFRSQQQPMPAAPTTMPAAPTPSPRQPAPEDPLTRFRRMVEELMRIGMSYSDAVAAVDEQHPDLRERSVELARYRSTVAADHRKAKAAAWRVEVQRRFNARRGV